MRIIATKKTWVVVLIAVIILAILILSPFGAEVAQADHNSTHVVKSSDEKKAPAGLSCGITALDHCVALLGYYLFFWPASWLLIVAGAIFDSMMAFSLSRSVINQPFVMEGWRAVRDVANMAFIFVLLYISIATILNLGNYKKFLVNLVIVALLINFSAFFTKVVIDASNIVALEFYNAIAAPVTDYATGITVKETSISAVFITGFDPQKIVGSEVFKNWIKEGNSVASLFFVFIAGGVISIVASYALLRVGFMFLSRLVAFWFLIIASPLAFIAFALPNASFANKWWHQLVSQALVAPVFLFLMYIIAKIVQSGFLNDVFKTRTGEWYEIIVNVILTFSVLIVALLKSVSITEKLAGEAGGMAKKLTGLLAFTPAGRLGRLAGGLARRQLVQRPASAIARSRIAKRFAAKSPRIGGAAIGALDTAGGATYDKYIAKKAKESAAIGKRIGERGPGERRFEGAARQEIYTRGLEKPTRLQSVTGDARVSREAAMRLRKKKTNIEKIAEEVSKTNKSQTSEGKQA
ncbi:MAG: hypothetical protein BMS9Abin13_580 [Patescibacteria group bacterium]|nr:MAG: hypothetical protein BMS9Abin13_580 [Patescibacteria group bacterium]